MKSTSRVVLFAADPGQSLIYAGWLEAAGIRVVRNELLDLADEVLRRERPDLVVAAAAETDEPIAMIRAGRAASALNIPAIALIAPGPDLISRAEGFADWVTVDRGAEDLPRRVEWLLSRPADGPTRTVDPRFLALVVHDLRTPLNVIGLTIRAIGQSNPTDNPEFEEDLSFLQENAKQIERMLAQLGDLSRLIESERTIAPVEFESRRFLADFLEEKQAKRDSEFKGVKLEFAPDSPAVVCLDPTKARLALGHALANAAAAAGDVPIKIRSRGPGDSWTIEFVVDKAPPPTATPAQLRSDVFERLVGSPAERRGLDLAIATRVSELFGGSARLDVEVGVRSIVSLEWPARLDRSHNST